MVRSRPRRGRRDVHASTPSRGFTRRRLHHLELRPGRDGGAGRRQPGRVLRPQADAARTASTPIIRRNLGSKLIKMEFATPRRRPPAASSVKTVDVAAEQRNRYSLTDADVIELAKLRARSSRSTTAARWTSSGARTARDGKLYILQARPETVKSQAAGKAEQRYKLKGSRHRARRGPRDRPEDRHRPGARRPRPSPTWTGCSRATCSSPT